jgi:hypothetical protein
VSDDDFTQQDWMTMRGQLDATREFWRHRMAQPQRRSLCAAWWRADYGPLWCTLPHGHGGMHLTFGSQGRIEFTGGGA